MHLEAEGTRSSRLAFHLRPSLLVASEAQSTIHLPASCEAGFLLERSIKFDGLAEELGDVSARTKLTDESCRVPGATGGQLISLDQDYVFPAKLGQVVCGRRADDAAADDDDARLCWKGCHECHPGLPQRLGIKAARGALETFAPEFADA